MSAALENLDAERAVLGAILLGGPVTLLLAREALADPMAFTTAQHRSLYTAFLALAEAGTPWDTVTLVEQLRRAGTLEVTGGVDFLADLSDAVPSAANIGYYTAIVADLAQRRRVVAHATQATAWAEDLARPLATSVPEVVDALVRIAEPRRRSHQTPAAEFNTILRDIEQQAQFGDPVHGVPSGLRALDLLTDGWTPGRLVVVAARPKMGKTGFALAVAEHAAGNDSPVLFFTAEQPRRELQRRRLAMETGANLRAITSPQSLHMHTRALDAAAAVLMARPLTIDEEPRTPGAVRLAMQRHVAEHGDVSLVVVDYLGKYQSGGKQERHDLEVGAITDAFAQMALRYNVPVLLLCQLNRESVKGGSVRRPTVSDLRDSGSIEQDAAQVLFLYRDPALPETDTKTEIHVALNRFGPTGLVMAEFQRATGRWSPEVRVA